MTDPATLLALAERCATGKGGCTWLTIFPASGKW